MMRTERKSLLKTQRARIEQTEQTHTLSRRIFDPKTRLENMHLVNKEREETCYTEAGYLHLHCMNYYHDFKETQEKDDCCTVGSVNATIGIIVIGVITMLVIFCMVVMLYELFKYRTKRLIVNSQVAMRGRPQRVRQQPHRHRRNLREGPLPYLSRPPNYDDLCLSDKELPTFDDATSSSRD